MTSAESMPCYGESNVDQESNILSDLYDHLSSLCSKRYDT